MGMFDIVIFETGHPEAGIRAGMSFQTKHLGCGCGLYLVDRGESLRRIAMRAKLAGQKSESEAVPFHGDLLLVDERGAADEPLVVRFSAGRLDWIRRASDCPPDLMSLLNLRVLG